MDADQIQETCEGLTIAALQGGLLAAFEFRHDDTDETAVADRINVKAGAPVPQLEGFRGDRVEVTVSVQTKTAAANAPAHGEAYKRLKSKSIWLAAATATGLDADDDLEILTEEMGGDREETKNLRIRSIIVPMLIRIN